MYFFSVASKLQRATESTLHCYQMISLKLEVSLPNFLFVLGAKMS